MPTCVEHAFAVKMAKWRERGPLRKWRKSRGLSTAEAAVVLGIAIHTFTSWEYGRHRPHYRKNKTEIIVPIKRGVNEGRKFFAWEEYMKPRTGITQEEFLSWLLSRPTM